MNYQSETSISLVNKFDIDLLNELVEELLVLKVKKELLRNKRGCENIGALIEVQEQIESKTNELFGLVLSSSLTWDRSLGELQLH